MNGDAETYGCILLKIAGANRRMDNKKRDDAGHRVSTGATTTKGKD